ncbi:hypothetical protein HDU85_007461 [Gaertneriomyces sp. JEL0708]|nr:hypothetical protein HDU85_007461 [Gaertneriomyces sp. JEL0708]
MTVVENPSGTQHQPDAGAPAIPKPHHHKHLINSLIVEKNQRDPKTMSSPTTTSSTTGWEFTKRMMQQHKVLRSHPLLTRILLSGIKAFLTGYTITFLPQLLKLLLQVRRLKEQVFWKMVAVMVKSARAPLPRFFLVLFGGCRVVEVGVAGVEGWARQNGWITFGERKSETGSVEGESNNVIARAAEGEEPLKLGACDTPVGGGDTEEGVQVPPSVECAVEEDSTTQTERDDTKHRHLLPRISPHVSFLSAFVSSLVAIHTLPRSHRTSIALFTVVRCIDALLSYHATTLKAKLNRYLPAFVSTHLDTITFITCCTQIMQSWFYYPSALPKSYVHWINKMSHMDARVLKALRLLGHGTMRYGEDTGHAHLVGDFAEEIGLDRAMGDPVNGLVPCLIVHQGREGCVNQWGWVWRTGFMDALKVCTHIRVS